MTTATRPEAVAAWTLHYAAEPDVARERVTEMCKTGIPEGHVGEWLGACFALTPSEDRDQLTKALAQTPGDDWYTQTFGSCPHGYIKPYCGQCAADEAKGSA
jgi:hypothetical protein